MEYNFKEIEPKWQRRWQENKTYKVETDPSRPKFYVLDMFPYPSGAGLHVGHPLGYIASDIYSRYKRQKGFNVLHPMGYDAFGLPAEQYAIQTGQHPAVTTERNIARYREQLDKIGFSFDWDREVRTCDPAYYKWTQWAFLKMFGSYYCYDKQQARPIEELTAAFEQGGTQGLNVACSQELHFTAEEWRAMPEEEKERTLHNYRLAFRADTMVNWCPKLGTVLANDEVHDGLSVRGGHPVEQKRMKQWLLRVTAYAQRMLDGLDRLAWSDSLKEIQRNWIGRSTGAEVDFKTTEGDTLTVYTTRCDTLFGVTYMVISPEHPFLEKWKDQITNWDAVEAYRQEAARKSDFERGELNKEKTGVRLEGIEAVHPVTGKHIPIFVSDYVLMGYGTGIVMGVPGHDQRDWDFATTFGLPIVEVVKGGDVTKCAFALKDDTGIMVNSDFLNGLTVKEAIPTMKKWVTEHGIGHPKTNFKLRDWVFSRQRYWGEPIPLVKCEKCGWVPLPEEQLPLLLPEVKSYELTDDGESPLSKMTDWVNTTCPKCGGPAQRETDTMPQWAGSCWYFLRYMDPHNDKALASKEALEYWSPVDWYNGGMEHTTLHLLYSRFWHKFLYDIGAVPTKEPYAKRTSHGMILGEGGEKMSKSRGNVVNPNDIVAQYGADTMRLYIMFVGDFEQAATWSTDAVKGSKRFLDKVWNLAESASDSMELTPENEAVLHKTIKKVTDDIDTLKMNTAIAAMMTAVNEMTANGVTRGDLGILLRLLNPFAPHITEELWEKLGFAAQTGKMCCQAEWPVYDESKTIASTVEMAIQVNGKMRGTVQMPADSDEETVKAAALAVDKVQKATSGMQIVKTILVKNRLINLIVKPQ